MRRMTWRAMGLTNTARRVIGCYFNHGMRVHMREMTWRAISGGSWMEVLFAAGYRPGLVADVNRRVKIRVEAMDAAAKAKGQ